MADLVRPGKKSRDAVLTQHYCYRTPQLGPWSPTEKRYLRKIQSSCGERSIMREQMMIDLVRFGKIQRKPEIHRNEILLKSRVVVMSIRQIRLVLLKLSNAQKHQ